MTQTDLHESKEGLPTLQERHLPPSSKQLNVTPADCKQMSIVFQLSRREGI